MSWGSETCHQLRSGNKCHAWVPTAASAQVHWKKPEAQCGGEDSGTVVLRGALLGVLFSLGGFKMLWGLEQWTLTN